MVQSEQPLSPYSMRVWYVWYSKIAYTYHYRKNEYARDEKNGSARARARNVKKALYHLYHLYQTLIK